VIQIAKVVALLEDQGNAILIAIAIITKHLILRTSNVVVGSLIAQILIVCGVITILINAKVVWMDILVILRKNVNCALQIVKHVFVLNLIVVTNVRMATFLIVYKILFA
jgi:hypothetical protein